MALSDTPLWSVQNPPVTRQLDQIPTQLVTQPRKVSLQNPELLTKLFA